MRYAIQHKTNGQLVDYCESIEQAAPLLEKCNYLELVELENSSKIELNYIELGGPWGYGCNTPEFTTYGGLLKCIRRLIQYLQDSARTFGPDPRDIKDYFRHCHLYVNGEDKSQWLWEQTDKINLKTIIA